MYRSSWGLILPLWDYKLLPLFARIFPFLGFKKKFWRAARKGLEGVFKDTDTCNNLRKVLCGDGQERVN